MARDATDSPDVIARLAALTFQVPSVLLLTLPLRPRARHHQRPPRKSLLHTWTDCLNPGRPPVAPSCLSGFGVLASQPLPCDLRIEVVLVLVLLAQMVEAAQAQRDLEVPDNVPRLRTPEKRQACLCRLGSGGGPSDLTSMVRALSAATRAWTCSYLAARMLS